MLNYAKENLDVIEKDYKLKNGSYKGETIAKFFKGTEIHKKYNLEPLGDSLKKDVGCSIASYLELKQANADVSFPETNKDRINVLYEKINELLNEISFNTSLSKEQCHNLEQEIKNLYRKINNINKYRPISFARYDFNRDACLLYNPKKNSYYAKLYVFNKITSKEHVKLYKQKSIKHKDDIKLYYLPTLEIYKENRSIAYIIVPLAFGKWHERFLKQARKRKMKFCAMKLIKRGEDFYLDIPLNEDIETRAEKKKRYEEQNKNGEVLRKIKKKKKEFKNKLGIDLGITNIATIAVLDKDNNLLFSKQFNGNEYKEKFEIFVKKLAIMQMHGSSKYPRDKKYISGILHRVANEIIDLSKKYEAQIYLEDLNIDKSHERIKSTKKFENLPNKLVKRVVKNINRWAYGQMYRILVEKCEREGLPKLIRLNPRYTSENCSRCGHNEKVVSKGERVNRESQERFVCKNCGLQINADVNAAINIATKYSKVVSFKSKEVNGYKVINHELFDFKGIGKDNIEALNDFINKLREYKKEYDKIPFEIRKSDKKLRGQYKILKDVDREDYENYYNVED